MLIENDAARTKDNGSGLPAVLMKRADTKKVENIFGGNIKN